MRPIRSFIPTISIVLGLWTAPSAWAQAPVYQSESGPYSDVTVVSCLSFYVLASCRSTLLGGRVALRLLDAGRRWAINRGAVEWQMHVTSGFRINPTDRMLRRVGFRQTGGNYALGLTGEGSR